MRSPTVGASAIAKGLHLLTFLGQVVEGLQMLQPNGVLAIPNPYGATKLVYCADYPPTPTLAPEFRIVFNKDLAHFADLVGIGYFRPFHDALHNIFDDSTSGHFPASKFYRLLPRFLLFLGFKLCNGMGRTWRSLVGRICDPLVGK